MCEHKRLDQFELPVRSTTSGPLDQSMISDVYDTHASALFGSLMQVLRCEDCSNLVLVHTFTSIALNGGSRPRLCQLLSVAFAQTIASAEERDQQLLRQRITTWFAQAPTANAGLEMPNASDSSAPRLE